MLQRTPHPQELSSYNRIRIFSDHLLQCVMVLAKLDDHHVLDAASISWCSKMHAKLVSSAGVLASFVKDINCSVSMTTIYNK